MLAFVPLIIVTNSAYGATVFYANGEFTQNGIEWCEENKPLYDILGDKFFEHHKHSIESRICANLIEDPLWSYFGPDRIERLVERSGYFSQLEINESKEEAKIGVLDPTPAEIPKIQIEGSPEAIEEEIEPLQESNEQGGGCLIATAAFGSEMSTPVQMLREVRDSKILTSEIGKKFFSDFNYVYYSFSPTIADWERQNSAFKESVKIFITPLITTLSLLNHQMIDTEEKIIGYGMGIIFLNILFYLGIPIFSIVIIKRNYKRSFLSWKRSDPNQTYLK